MCAKGVGMFKEASLVLLGPVYRAVIKQWSIPWLLRRPLSDYGFVSRLFAKYELGQLPGDVLEIGTWLGFGTVRLATMAYPFGKAVHAADQFLVDFDNPKTKSFSTAGKYVKLYRGLTQRQVFDRNLRGHTNVVVHAGNSMKLDFPDTQRFVCSFIDGGHTVEVVSHDLTLAWEHTSPGGLVVLDDYGNDDWPDVQKVVDEFIAAHSNEILTLEHTRRRIGIMKRPSVPRQP